MLATNYRGEKETQEIIRLVQLYALIIQSSSMHSKNVVHMYLCCMHTIPYNRLLKPQPKGQIQDLGRNVQPFDSTQVMHKVLLAQRTGRV